MLSDKERPQLLQLYRAYCPERIPEFNIYKQRLRLQAHFLDSETEVAELLGKIYNPSKKQKRVSTDLAVIAKLLAGDLLQNDNQPNENEADYWVKKRVHQLLYGSLFWVKEGDSVEVVARPRLLS